MINHIFQFRRATVYEHDTTHTRTYLSCFLESCTSFFTNTLLQSCLWANKCNLYFSSLQAVIGSSNCIALCTCSILHRPLLQSWPNWQTNSHCCLRFWVRWWVSWFFDPRSVVPEVENSSVFCFFVVGWVAVVTMGGWNFGVKWWSNNILIVQKKHLAHLHAQTGRTGQHI